MDQLNPKALDKILKVLRDHAVKSFRGGGLEIIFGDLPLRDVPKDEPSAAPQTEETSLPPDLRSDAINSYDAVMNWSASPDPSEPVIPGTGDEAL